MYQAGGILLLFLLEEEVRDLAARHLGEDENKDSDAEALMGGVELGVL